MKNKQEWKNKWDYVYSNSKFEYSVPNLDVAIPKEMDKIFSGHLLPNRAWKDTDIVLEIGCGNGALMLQVYSKVKELHGVDISSIAIEQAKKLFRNEKNVFLYDNTDLTKLFIPETFDVIYSITVFQHIPKKYTIDYINQCKQILKKDGMLFFNVLAPHKFFISDATLEDFNVDKHVPCVHFFKDELEFYFKDWSRLQLDFLKIEHKTDTNYGWYIGRATI